MISPSDRLEFCQSFDCNNRRRATVRVREGYHWYWACDLCSNGKEKIKDDE